MVTTKKELKRLQSIANRAINISDDEPDNKAKEDKANQKIADYNAYVVLYNNELDALNKGV